MRGRIGSITVIAVTEVSGDTASMELGQRASAWLGRCRVGLACVVLPVLAACTGAPPQHASAGGVSSSRPPWALPTLTATGKGGTSMCGGAFQVQIGDHLRTLGECNGVLPTHLPKPLVLTPGTVFYLRIMSEADGGLDYPIPDPSYKTVVRTARRGSIVQYLARAPGKAYLITGPTRVCQGIDPRWGSCPVIEVIVQNN